MTDYSAIVGLDVHKDTIAVAVADAGRAGEFWGEITNTSEAVASMLRKLGGRQSPIHFVYEAGPCCYGLHRQIMATQHHCEPAFPKQVIRSFRCPDLDISHTYHGTVGCGGWGSWVTQRVRFPSGVIEWLSTAGCGWNSEARS